MERRTHHRRSPLKRDAGLRRITKLTRWSLAGAVAGTGLFAGLASQAGGAATSSAKAPVKAAPQHTTPTTATAAATTTPPPTTPPTVVASNANASVVSGAS